MPRKSFVSALARIDRERQRNHLAAVRAQERQVREAARRQKLFVRQMAQHERAVARHKKLQAKETKERYLEGRLREVDDLNEDVKQRVEELGEILAHGLSLRSIVNFHELRPTEKYVPPPVPHELLHSKAAPDLQSYKSRVRPLSMFEKLFRIRARYARESEATQVAYDKDMARHAADEKFRIGQLSEHEQRVEESRQQFELKAENRNREIDEFEAGYRAGDPDDVVAYNSIVLERSEYPAGMPQEFRIAYANDSKEILIEYELPKDDVIPATTEYKYAKSTDQIQQKPRKASDIKDLYQEIVASIALRTIHEIFEADQAANIDIVVFNGFVNSTDPATGRPIRPCLLSVRTTRSGFSELNLARVDKRACLRNLGAQVSPQPQALQPVKPIIEFDMVDKRFIEQGDVLSDLESRPNLMDLNPSEFETLVGNLFGKMGLETKLTRASRDGGVDAVAYDNRPVLGGKVVIQAKRYKNTVEVSAVRDLYGTMLNEGASKGILVATSSFGQAAYEFSKDKPLELIDGGGLLYLLDQVGVKARIVMPEDKT